MRIVGHQDVVAEGAAVTDGDFVQAGNEAVGPEVAIIANRQFGGIAGRLALVSLPSRDIRAREFTIRSDGDVLRLIDATVPREIASAPQRLEPPLLLIQTKVLGENPRRKKIFQIVHVQLAPNSSFK